MITKNYKDVFETWCSNCGCNFSYDRGDMKWFYMDHINGENYFILHCPRCNNEMCRIEQMTK